MSNIFANKKPAAKAEVEDDFIGGGGVLDTDIYPATIKYAYIGKAQNSDARNLTLCLKVNGLELTRQIWMTNKNGDVTYKDKKTGEPSRLQTSEWSLYAAGFERSGQHGCRGENP